MSTLTFEPTQHAYAVDGRAVLSVTAILKLVGLVDLSRIPADVLEHKRTIGQAVHEATHYLDEDDLVPGSVDPAVQPYLEAYRRFRADKSFTPLYLETRVYHPRWHYAGTFDRLGTVPSAYGGLSRGVLLDLKTGDPELACANLQTAGYLEAYLQSPLPLPDVKTIDRWSVQLRADGTYRLHQYTDYRDRSVFLAAVQLANYRTFGAHQR